MRGSTKGRARARVVERNSLHMSITRPAPQLPTLYGEHSVEYFEKMGYMVLI